MTTVPVVVMMVMVAPPPPEVMVMMVVVMMIVVLRELNISFRRWRGPGFVRHFQDCRGVGNWFQQFGERIGSQCLGWSLRCWCGLSRVHCAERRDRAQ